MNLTLHHSLKDLRWLWPRVVVLVLALVFDFAVQMEWLWPMTFEQATMFAATLYSLPMWIIAWWVLLSVPPEEGGLAFRSTRPVSRLHYWLSRILTSVVAVMLPLMIENAAVLLAHGRPWVDVGRGVWETGLAVAVAMLWLLPTGTLFRGWEKYAALVLFIYCGFDGGPEWIFKWLHMPYREAWRFLAYDSNMTLRCGAIAGLLMLLFAFWHARRPMGRLMRLAVPVVMGMFWTLPAMFPSFPSAIEAGQDEALMKKLTQDRVVRMEADQVEVNKGGRGLELKTSIEFGELPPGIVPVWQVEKRRMMQDGQELRDVAEVRLDSFSDATDIAYLPFWKPLAQHVPGAWAADTLTNSRLDGMTRLATLSTKVNALKPITMELELSAQWARLRELGRMPLKKGSIIRTPQSEIEVLEVIAGMDNRENERREALTLRTRERHVTFGGRNAAFPFMPVLCLYAPEKRLLWQQVSDGERFERGTNHGWSTFQREITFLYGVLEPGTGVTKENLEKQELVWIGGEFLGSSRHEVKVENVVLGEQWREKDEWPGMPVSLTPKNPREAFLEHVKSIPKPAETATKEEIERYIAAVCSAERAYAQRGVLSDEILPKWPGDDLAVAGIIAPILMREPELLLKVPSEPSLLSYFLSQVIGEMLIQAGVPGVKRDPGASLARGDEFLPLSFSLDNIKSSNQKAVVIEALHRRQSPLLSGFHSPQPPDEELWNRGGNLAYFIRSPKSAFHENAVRIVNENYPLLPASTGILDGEERDLIYAAVALGMPQSLEWLLRIEALRDRQDLDLVSCRSSHHSIFLTGGVDDLNLKTAIQFVENCRHWSVKDFRYDAEKMCWELIQPKSKP